MKRILSIILVLAILAGFGVSANASSNYRLAIYTNGKATTTAAEGDIVSVTLVITSSDGNSIDLYSMQDYICFDPEYVRYVEGSLSTYADHNGNNVLQGSAIKFSADPIEHPNRVFVNRASLSGVTIASGTVLASFELEIVKNGTVTLGHDKIELFQDVGELLPVDSREAVIKPGSSGGSGGSGVITPPVEPEVPEEPEEPEEPSKEIIFVDVPSNAYYYDAVVWAAKEGITDGTSDTTFSPDWGCTRAQMVTFLWRANGCPEPSQTECVFEDVDLSSYYGKAVLWAIEQGITDGTSETTFSPEMVCSRAHMATFLFRMSKGNALGSGHPFVDVPANEYFSEPVQWAYENKITDGTSDNTYSPHNSCSRAQMVVFLFRLLAGA